MIKVNEYFDGKVKSLAFNAASGPATIGVMQEGEYTFGTSTIEHMTLISGTMSVMLPGESVFKKVKTNETFIVAANVKFQLRIEGQAAYLCLYK